MVLSKLAKKNIERFSSGGIKARLITKARNPSYLKESSEKSSTLIMRYNKIVFSLFILLIYMKDYDIMCLRRILYAWQLGVCHCPILFENIRKPYFEHEIL